MFFISEDRVGGQAGARTKYKSTRKGIAAPGQVSSPYSATGSDTVRAGLLLTLPAHARLMHKKSSLLVRTWLVLTVLMVVYLLVLLAIWHQQERLLFVPSALPADYVFQAGPDVSEHTVEVSGASIHVLQLKRPKPEGVVFFLHGNAGNLAQWFVNIDFYRRLNVDLVMMDYRGFGKSTGHISSQQQLEDDARAVWDRFIPAYDPSVRRIILGRSLGTGLAAQLAIQTSPATTILVSPYTSITALAEEQFPWLPASLVRYPLRTDAVIGEVPGKLFLLHGQRDTLIAPSHSARLAQIANAAGKSQVQAIVIEGAAHGDLQQFPDYLQAVRAAVLSQPRQQPLPKLA